MSDATEVLRDWAASDREQADALDWFSAVSTDQPHAAEQAAKADALRATADGWEAVAQAAEDAVENPDA